MREIKFRIWDNEMIYDNCIAFHADPVYVMQYTGLKDCHGKEIYEGDIIYFKQFEINTIKPVTFKEGVFGIEWHEYTTLNTQLKLTPLPELEVIGNIYENPELLEKSPC